jgi:hypothetical protein
MVNLALAVFALSAVFLCRKLAKVLLLSAKGLPVTDQRIANTVLLCCFWVFALIAVALTHEQSQVLLPVVFFVAYSVALVQWLRLDERFKVLPFVRMTACLPILNAVTLALLDHSLRGSNDKDDL